MSLEFDKSDFEGQGEALIQTYFPFVDLKTLTVDEYESWMLKAQWLEKRYFENMSKVIAQPITKTIVDVAKKMTRRK